jgi:hypothetical protein
VFVRDVQCSNCGGQTPLRDSGEENNVRIHQISLSFALLLLTLSFSSCRQQQLVAGENIVNITKKQPSGCTITITNPQIQGNPKDPRVSAGLFASVVEQLEVSADGNYQISFPKGSPLQNPPPPIHSGKQSFPISNSTRFCATFSLTGQCQYSFEVYDPNYPTKPCDPIVHVTP